MGEENSTADSADILDPDQEIKIRGGKETITVRELDWRATRKLFKKLNSVLAKCIKVTDILAGKVEFDFDVQSILELLTGDFAEDMVCGATRKGSDWVGNLDNSDFLRLLDAAIALNLRPEMFALGNGLAARVKTLMTPAAPALATETDSEPSIATS